MANNEYARPPITIGGVVLEKECPACKGTGDNGEAGFLLKFIGGVWCSTCRCKGVVPTKEGELLIEFFVAHATTGIDGGGLRKK